MEGRLPLLLRSLLLLVAIGVSVGRGVQWLVGWRSVQCIRVSPVAASVGDLVHPELEAGGQLLIQFFNGVKR